MSIWDFLKQFTGTVERPSSSDIVQDTAITFDEYTQKVIIDLRQLNIPFTSPLKCWVCPIPDTNSMDPVFDYGNYNILIQGGDQYNQQMMVNFLKVGDIAVYRHPQMYAIHRIVEIGSDKEGRYFRFKGDNNASKDSYKVRDSMVEWLYCGTIC